MNKRLGLASIAMFAIMMAVLMASCAPEGFVIDPAREKAHDLTVRAYKEAYQSNEPDWDRVVSLATRAIKADSAYPLPYSLRGAAYNAKGQYTLAVNDLDNALELSSDFSPAYINRGISYMRLELYDLAQLDFESALELDPDNITSLVNIAHIFTLEGDLLLACRFLEKAVLMGFDDLSLLNTEPAFKPLIFSGCQEKLEKRIMGR